MPKSLLVFSLKGIPDTQREDLVTQLKMVAESMEVGVNIIDAAKPLSDPKLKKIAVAVHDLLAVRMVDSTLLDEHRINQDLHALRAEGLFENNYCIVLTGDIYYISGNYENGFVAHDNIAFIKNLSSHSVMGLINEVFARLEIG
ncbi:TPA: hypothetical protein H1012_01765 [archaeon]|nr:hypothetical protein [Candidatus Naiadarchaeales archaeon SRR2090153.bin461]HIK02552.1 hypothetical protein [Candidatus Naiadarchaeales archaeon SRR2090159.bin1288]